MNIKPVLLFLSGVILPASAKKQPGKSRIFHS